MQHFAGQIRCIMGDVQVAYSAFFSLDLQSQTKIVGKVVQLNSSREFSLLLNIPVYLIQCWDITEQLRAQILMFCSTLGQGRGEEGKKIGKKTFPTLLTMTVASSAGITVRLSCF